MIKRRYGYLIHKLSHHTDKFGKRAQNRASAVCVSYPYSAVTSPALLDTRAQIMASMDLVHKLGDNSIKAVRD